MSSTELVTAVRTPIVRLIAESILYQSLMLALRDPFSLTLAMDMDFLRWLGSALHLLWNEDEDATKKSVVLRVPLPVYQIILDTMALNASSSLDSVELTRLEREMKTWEDFGEALAAAPQPLELNDEMKLLYVLAASVFLAWVAEGQLRMRDTEPGSSPDASASEADQQRVYDQPVYRWQVARAMAIVRRILDQEDTPMCYLACWPLKILGYAAYTDEDMGVIKEALILMWEIIGYGEVKRISEELGQVWSRRRRG